jgi:hypothetical protein
MADLPKILITTKEAISCLPNKEIFSICVVSSNGVLFEGSWTFQEVISFLTEAEHIEIAGPMMMSFGHGIYARSKVNQGIFFEALSSSCALLEAKNS